MSSQSDKLLDPMYNFDTHFPERLSRLHLHEDLSLSKSFQRKNKSSRCGSRYKTQPVTFDEIQEVDEEPFGSPGADKVETIPEHLKDLLQPISRSMDGLLARSASTEQPHQLQPCISRSRPGSKKSQRHPACILEGVDLEQQQQLTAYEKKPPQVPHAATKSSESKPSSTIQITTSLNLLKPSGTAEVSPNDATIPLVPSPNIGQRRQKVTAKAKKRQQAMVDGDVL